MEEQVRHNTLTHTHVHVCTHTFLLHLLHLFIVTHTSLRQVMFTDPRDTIYKLLYGTLTYQVYAWGATGWVESLVSTI